MAETLYELIQKPFVQVLFFLLLTILSFFTFSPKNADQAWTMAGFIFIGFMLVNSLLICFASNGWIYFFLSLGYSVLYLLGVAMLMPTMIRLLKIEGTAESGMIFIFIIYHPAFLLVMMFLKWAYLKFVQ